MALQEIKAFKTSDNKVFTNKDEASEHQSKLDIIVSLESIDELSNSNISADDLDVFTLEVLRRTGRIAEEILKNK